MRKQILLILSMLFFVWMGQGCVKNENGAKTLKDKFVGEWIEISPCDSCISLTFAVNDCIYQRYKYDSLIYYSNYSIVNDSCIQVTRNWETKKNKTITKHKFIFFSNDTLFIQQFSPVDIGVDGFQDVLLTKVK